MVLNQDGSMDLVEDMGNMDFFEELHENPLDGQEENVAEDGHDEEARILVGDGKNLQVEE